MEWTDKDESAYAEALMWEEYEMKRVMERDYASLTMEDLYGKEAMDAWKAEGEAAEAEAKMEAQ